MAIVFGETWGQERRHQQVLNQGQCQDVEPRLNSIVDPIRFLEPQTGRS